MHTRCQILRDAFECRMANGYAYEACVANDECKSFDQDSSISYHDGIMLVL